MNWIYLVVWVTGVGWSMIPGYYPMVVEDCKAKAERMLPLVSQLTKEDDNIKDFELGCIKADTLEELRNRLRLHLIHALPSKSSLRSLELK